MDFPEYARSAGLHVISNHLLDLRSDVEVDHDLLRPSPVSSDKNVWFFWHSGYANMHSYTQRNIRAWHRRFSKQGWTIRVLDRQTSSSLNVVNFLDVSDAEIFPNAFIDGTIGGDYASQHTSDLVRWSLLLKYGGVYADVGMIQIGDLDRLWNETIGDPHSDFEILSYDDGGNGRGLTNYFLASGPNNPFFARCHRLLLHLWAEDGGKTSTDGMHQSPLLEGVPLMGGSFIVEEKGKKIEAEEVARMLTDYIIQGQVMSMVMALVDDEDGWNGPKYIADHVYAVDFMAGSQLINEITEWDGRKAFALMSLTLPKKGEVETDRQKQARGIVEACLQKSFEFKLTHGLILRVFGATLKSLWRKHEGSDNVPGTVSTNSHDEGTLDTFLRAPAIYNTSESAAESGELQIKIACVSLNLTDYKHASMSLPSALIIGCDFPGEVTAFGTKVLAKSFAIQDFVAGVGHGYRYSHTEAFAEDLACIRRYVLQAFGDSQHEE